MDAPRLLRPPLWAASHHHFLLTPSLAAAMAARETAAPLAASPPGRSVPPPSPAYTVATPWRRPCHGAPRALVRAGAGSHGAGQNCGTSGTTPADPASLFHPGQGC